MSCIFCFFSIIWIMGLTMAVQAAEIPAGANPTDPLLKIGCLDVTKSPYAAGPMGVADSTQAIQRAVNDARDHGLVCFFPEGTYLISDTISCEQQVRKLDRPRYTDGQTQHYWDLPHRIIILGSTKGKRPMLKLAAGARGFDDPSKPKMAVWIWAQTRHDAPGKEEPEWGKEQPNVSFNHIFRGIDVDIRSHAGAVGIRHSGSQGLTLQDVTVLAEGAYAGLSNCCGQGGGTYNIEVIGGEYGIVLEPMSRFPLLTSCSFRNQTGVAIRYTMGGCQVPTLLVGCELSPASGVAVDLTTERHYAGISLVDCIVTTHPGGVICQTRLSENIFMEEVLVRAASAICSDGHQLPSPNGWNLVRRYFSQGADGINLINGSKTATKLLDAVHAVNEPSVEAMRRRHYRPGPSFEDADAFNVCDYGAMGDGQTDDTSAFERAIAEHRKVFVPKGHYRLKGHLQLRAGTQLFGFASSLCTIGGAASSERFPGNTEGEYLVLSTVDHPDASPGLYFLGVRGRIEWRSGQGTIMLAPGALSFSGHGGGRLYGVMAMRRQLLLEGITQPTSFYALNVERVTTNPQSEIRDSSHIRVYYFKVESGTIQRPNAGDANPPCRIANSRDVRVYCMYGNVKKLVNRPMLELVDSAQVVVSQLKAFSPGSFPHLRETSADKTTEIPSTNTCALFVPIDSECVPGI